MVQLTLGTTTVGRSTEREPPEKRKMLAKQPEGAQENEKERPGIMSCTSGLPSSWCRVSSVTVALSGQGGVCFRCRCNEACRSIAATPITSWIMHAHSAYFFQMMAKQQKPACMGGLFYMCSQRSSTDGVWRASKEVWSKPFWFKRKRHRAVCHFLTVIEHVRQPIRQMWCAPVGISFLFF